MNRRIGITHFHPFRIQNLHFRSSGFLAVFQRHYFLGQLIKSEMCIRDRAREADLGIAGGKGVGLLIRKGEVVKKVPEGELLQALREELLKLQKN